MGIQSPQACSWCLVFWLVGLAGHQLVNRLPCIAMGVSQSTDLSPARPVCGLVAVFVAQESCVPSPFPCPSDRLRPSPCQMIQDIIKQMLQWKGYRQMKGDLSFQLTDASCDFEESVLYGIDLCIYPPCALQPDVC